MVKNAIEDDKDEMSHSEAMEEAVDERAFTEGMIWEIVEANEIAVIAQNIVLEAWGRGAMMHVNINNVETRSTNGMKDGVGESAKAANPAERIGKTMLGCLVKTISLKPTICAGFLRK